MNETSPIYSAPIERGGSQSDLRRYNERVVLSAIDRHPGMFNAELARRTGLAAQTISVILRSLDKQGLLRRGPVLRGRRGQPATPIYLRPQGAYGMGAAIGWRQLSVCVTDFVGNVLAIEHWPYPHPHFDDVMAQIVSAVGRLVEALPASARPRTRGLGVSMPFFIEQNLPALGAGPGTAKAWEERDLRQELADALDTPVWIVNDGMAASSAEAEHHEGAPSSDFGYLFVGSFLGGGMVLGARPFPGPNGNGATLGSMVVSDGKGNCTQADLVASMRVLEARLAAAGHAHGPDGDGEWDWQSSRAVVEQWVSEAAHVLAHAVLNTHCVLDFDTMVIDGAMPRDLLALLVEETRAVLSTLPSTAILRPAILEGRLGTRASVLGAARVPLYNQFFSLDANA